MRSNLSFLASSVFAVVVLGACGPGNAPDSREAREQQMEKYAAQYGVDANVDLSRGTPNVTINQGTGQIGTDLSVPAGFPDDIPVYPELRIFSSNSLPMGVAVQGQVAAAAEDIAAFYIERMAANGWTNRSDEVQAPTMRSLNFEKGNRTTGINLISGDDGATTVQVTALTLG